MPVVREASMVEEVAITAEQRERFLAAIRDDPNVGHLAVLRSLGVAGSAGQLRQLLADPEWREEIAEARRDVMKARGLGIGSLLDKLAFVVNDDGNASQLRGIQMAFGLHGVTVGERVEHQHTGHLEVSNPDVAAAIDRFTALADAAVRAAARNRPGDAAQGALPAG